VNLLVINDAHERGELGHDVSTLTMTCSEGEICQKWSQ